MSAITVRTMLYSYHAIAQPAAAYVDTSVCIHCIKPGSALA